MGVGTHIRFVKAVWEDAHQRLGRFQLGPVSEIGLLSYHTGTEGRSAYVFSLWERGGLRR